MNKYLSQLKKEFGKYGSWALWDKDGGIKKIAKAKVSDLKPSIIFMGLNASYDLRIAAPWMNYHAIPEKKISWKREHCSKLAEVLSEPEFSCLSGAYMTDIIKTQYDPDSGDLMKIIKKDKSILKKNEKLLEEETRLLSRISKPKEFLIICIGNKSFEILSRMPKYKAVKIWHYSAYQLGWQGVKKRIRQDLRRIIKQYQKT